MEYEVRAIFACSRCLKLKQNEFTGVKCRSVLLFENNMSICERSDKMCLWHYSLMYSSREQKELWKQTLQGTSIQSGILKRSSGFFQILEFSQKTNWFSKIMEQKRKGLTSIMLSYERYRKFIIIDYQLLFIWSEIEAELSAMLCHQ